MHSNVHSTNTAPPGANKKTLGLVFFTICLDLMGFGIIIPVQPFFAESLGASHGVVTLLGASYSLMQFLFAPYFGRLSDRIGRRPVILASLAMNATGYVCFGFAPTLFWLFASRMLSGLGSANLGAAQAIVADVTSGKDRAKGMGIIGAAFGIGFIIGPAVGGALGQISPQAPAFASAVLCALNWFGVWKWLPETSPKAGSPGFSFGLSLKSLTRAARFENVAPLFAIYLIFPIAFAMMEQVLGLFIEATWLREEMARGASAKPAAAMTAGALMLVGVTAAIVQGGLIGRLVTKFGEKRLLAVGMSLVAISFLGIGFTSTFGGFPLFLALCVAMAAGTGMSNPSLMSLLSRSVDPKEQGTVLGLGQSLASLGRVIGPSAAGTLFEQSHALPFQAGAVLILVAVGIATTVRISPRSN